MPRDDTSPTLDALLAETAWIRALARSLVVDPGTADDVAQDATVIALTKPPSDAGALRGWLRRVVRNLASNARRGESRRGAREKAVAGPEAEEAADDVVARWEVRRQVVEAVLSLAEPYRSTILLRFFDGLTAAAAASRLGVPLETVRTRTRRGLDLLRGRLAHLDDGKGRRGHAVLLLLARREADLVGTTAGTATGAGSGAVAGGVAMASAGKWVGVAVLALVGIAMTWSAVSLLRSPDRAAEMAAAAQRPAGPVRVRRAPPPADTTKPAGPDGVDLDSCDRERDLFGVVVGPDGKPVAGAKVQALRLKPTGQLIAQRGFLDPYVAGEETKSGFDGTFALRLPPREAVTLRVEAEGFALWESAFRQAGERVRVTLSPALTLTVSVKSHDGAPVADADVRVTADNEPAGVTTITRRHAATGPDGRVRLGGIPRASKLFLFVSPARHPHAMQRIDVLDAAEQTVEVVLPEGRRLRVSVVDRLTGAGIAGAEVRCNTDALAGTTGPDGRLDLAEVPKDSGTQVEATAVGYARGSIRIRATDAEASLPLEHASQVTGRIVDADGRPVTGADIVGMEDSAPSNEDGRSIAGATSGDDGRFALEGLAPNKPHLVRVRASGWGITVARALTASADPWTVDVGDVRLAAARTILGSVVDADHKPVARMDVRLTSADRQSNDPVLENRRTDDLGRFAFSGIPPGSFTLTAQSDAPATLRESADVEVRESRDPAPVTIRLGGTPEQAKARIPVRVRVTDENGNPLAGIQVQIGYAANGATGSQITGADGALSFEAQHEPASVLVYLSAEQARALIAADASPLRPGQRDAAIVIRHGRVISGKVVGEDDKPFVLAGVTAWSGSKRVGGGATDQEGRFTFAVAGDGKVDLEAIPQDEPRVLSRSAGELVGVGPGAADLVIRVVREPATRAIDVEVVDDAGAPVAKAQINTEFHGRDWSRPLLGTTGADGRCRIEGLPRAPVLVAPTIAARAPGSNRHWSPQAVRIGADQDSVKIVLPKPRVIRGRVVGEDGTPVAGAIVHASPGESPQGSMDAAGPDGYFELLVPPDAPLPFAVHAMPMPPDPTRPQTGWDLVEADDRELEIVLHAVPKR